MLSSNGINLTKLFTVYNYTHHLQWHGLGGFHQCVGTTTEEAFLNEKLRDELSRKKELTDLYKQIRIPGLGMVIFDKARALDQIRSVLAEMKKKKQQFKESDSIEKGKLQNVRLSVVTMIFTSMHTLIQ